MPMTMKYGSSTAWRTAREVGADEQDAIINAFGSTGGTAVNRQAAVPYVANRQNREHWYFCGCLPANQRPPALYPRAHNHLVRRLGNGWPQHNESCPFFLEPAEHRRTLKSQIRPRDGYQFRLVRAFRRANNLEPRAVRRASPRERRDSLATILFDVMTRAGLQKIAPQHGRPSIAEQYRSIKRAADEIFVDDEIALRRVIKTSPGYLDELLETLNGNLLEWSRSSRPHGILIFPATGAAGGFIRWAGGQLEVNGVIKIFGEKPPEDPEMAADRFYMAAALVAQPAPEEEFTVIRAYLHPCLGDGDFMLVDSDYERQTIALMMDLQIALSADEGVNFEIEKPLFDVGNDEEYADAAEAAGIDGGEEIRTREILIPDFILRSEDAPGHRAIIVETMGFSDPMYRERKARIHPLMAQFVANAPVVEHDFHEPRCPQPERNQFFLEGLRAFLLD